MKNLIFLLAFTFTVFVNAQNITVTPLDRIPYFGANRSFTTAYNGYANNFLSGVTSITSINGTTSLTVLSAREQRLTGTANQTFFLPDATTLPLGYVVEFNNNSTGTLTVANFLSVSQLTISTGGYVKFILQNNSTADGVWDFHPLLPANASFGTNAAVITSSTTIGTGAVVTNTGNLGVVRIKQGTSFLDFGQNQGAFPAIWMQQATPTTANYAMAADVNSTYFNGPSSLIFNSAGSPRAFLSASIFSTSVPFFASSTATIGGDLYMTTNNKSLYGKGSDGINYSLLNFGTGDNITIQGRQGTSDIYLSPNGSSVSIACKGNNGNVGIKNQSPVASLDVNGNVKISATTNTLGAAVISSAQSSTLTMGAISGTNAVLSDVNFCSQFMWPAAGIADNTTYFVGALPYSMQPVSFGPVYVPNNCTLIGWSLVSAQTTTASAESATLQIAINGSTTNLSTGINFHSTINSYTNTGLSINISAGSKVEPVIITPKWATNPSGLGGGIVFWYRRNP